MIVQVWVIGQGRQGEIGSCTLVPHCSIYMEEGEGSRGEEEGRKGRGDKVCEVCTAPSLGHNFGAVSCESCKAFFRRNAFRLQV